MYLGMRKGKRQVKQRHCSNLLLQLACWHFAEYLPLTWSRVWAWKRAVVLQVAACHQGEWISPVSGAQSLIWHLDNLLPQPIVILIVVSTCRIIYYSIESSLHLVARRVVLYMDTAIKISISAVIYLKNGWKLDLLKMESCNDSIGYLDLYKLHRNMHVVYTYASIWE